jgi:hypothetical protein
MDTASARLALSLNPACGRLGHLAIVLWEVGVVVGGTVTVAVGLFLDAVSVVAISVGIAVGTRVIGMSDALLAVEAVTDPHVVLERGGERFPWSECLLYWWRKRRMTWARQSQNRGGLTRGTTPHELLQQSSVPSSSFTPYKREARNERSRTAKQQQGANEGEMTEDKH